MLMTAENPTSSGRLQSTIVEMIAPLCEINAICTGLGRNRVKGGIDVLVGEHESQTVRAHNADAILCSNFHNLDFEICPCFSGLAETGRDDDRQRNTFLPGFLYDLGNKTGRDNNNRNVDRIGDRCQRGPDIPSKNFLMLWVNRIEPARER